MPDPTVMQQATTIMGTAAVSLATCPLPTNASTDRTTAAGPYSIRFSDGTNFYDGTKTGQLPTTLTAGGSLKVANVEALPAGTNVIGGVTQSGTWTVQPGNTANTTAWKVDGSAVTQPISGAVSQSGTWTVQPGNTANTTAWKVDASSVAVPVTDNAGSLTVDAPVGTPVAARLSDGVAFLTTTAGRLSVDGSGVTQPVSGTVTANAGTGTFNIQANASVNLNQYGGAATTLGQKAMASSMPVTIASDQSAVPVSGTITANIGTSGSLALDASLTTLDTDLKAVQARKISDGTNSLTMLNVSPLGKEYGLPIRDVSMDRTVPRLLEEVLVQLRMLNFNVKMMSGPYSSRMFEEDYLD